VPADGQVAVPAQYGLGAHQQRDAAQHLAGESVQQGGEQCSVSRGEPYLLAAQQAFEDHDLVPESQDLRILGAVAHGQQPQQRERVGHAEVRQSTQHSQASSASRRWRKRAGDDGRGTIPSW
jgi:hypothetical protein